MVSNVLESLRKYILMSISLAWDSSVELMVFENYIIV